MAWLRDQTYNEIRLFEQALKGIYFSHGVPINNFFLNEPVKE